ncbi:MAG: 16S rRNA (guanine(527)-N(7))-methyltransferase RsmG [Clostridia bacterium]|nr:16S rRNA (guanine(527)-N(7))-methyltransferase RsmG [Clostridia bacterium]
MIDKLISRAAKMGICLTREQAEKFQTYHRMLTEANAQFNLTRVPEDLDEAIDRNYLDCISPLAKGLPEGTKTIIDVGSGAGFPGIPLSICLPDVHFTLMDALGKRVDFLKSVISALDLNAEAIHLRAEDGARKPELRECFDIATARAVAALNLLSEYLLPFVKVGGQMMVLKGPGLDDEIAQAENAFSILGGRFHHADTVSIPGRDWDHRIAWIEKMESTPEKYPRRAGKPEKKPL